MLTPAHLDELWLRIEELNERMKQDPDNRMVALLLCATLDSYNAKQKLLMTPRHCDN
jgi:hypothetical protein